MRKLTLTIASIFAALIFGVLVVFGQDAEGSQLIEFVEEQISSPSYQIRLNGLEGTLSSDVSLASITIADEDGIWLRIEKPKLIWTRSALLRGRLVVDSLEAEKIDFMRKPKEDASLPSPESGSFQIPELPVAVVLEKLNLPLVEFGPDVMDLASKASVKGKIIIDDGSMDVDLAINRLDGAGGKLIALAKYEKTERTLDLDIKLTEPQNGIVASSLNLEGRPPISLTINGKAPLSDLKVALAFDVDQKRILDGNLQLGENENGIQAKLGMEGPLSEILPQDRRAFFGENSVLDATMQFATDGSFVLEQSSAKSGAINFTADAATTKDGFLNALNLDLLLAANDNSRISIPSEKNDITVSSARLNIDYDATKNQNWLGNFRIDNFRNDELWIEAINLDTTGTVDNILDAANRSLTYNSNGEIYAITAKNPSIAQALGSSIKLTANGEWQSGRPLNLDSLNVIGDTLNIAAQGAISDMAFDGVIAVDADNLEAFSAVAGSELSGSINLKAEGKIIPLTGGFNISIDGNAKSLFLGNAQIDPLLGGKTKLSGGVARTTAGLGFDLFKLSNDQIEANVNGQLSSKTANINAEAFIKDVKVLDENSSGKLQLDLNLNGNQAPFNLATQIGMKRGTLAGQNVEDIALKFLGKSDGASLNGDISSTGLFSGQVFDVAGNVSASDKQIDVKGLLARIGFSEIQGDFNRQSNGLMQSELKVDSKDISSLAALLLTKASGSVKGIIKLKPEVDRTQTANFDLVANQVTYENIKIGNAGLSGIGNDILVQPQINAEIEASDIFVSGIEAKSVNGRVTTNGNKSQYKLEAVLAQNQSRVTTSGEVEQTGVETKIMLQKLLFNSNIANARLLSPSTVTIRNEITSFNGADIAIGSGKINLSGTAGKQLDIAATISNVPLTILNSLSPELGASGTLNGTLTASGDSSNPNVVFNIDGQNILVKQIADAGLSAIQVSTNGTFKNNIVRLDRLALQNAQELNLQGSGNLPLKGNGLDLGLRGTLPLSILEQSVVERGTSIQGIANIAISLAGSLDQPQASGSVNVNNGSIIDPLSNVRLNNVSLDVDLAGSQNAIIRMQGNLASGGSVAANGSVSLAEGLPANINILLNSAKYGDGETFSTTVDGKLALSGNLIESPLLSGNLNLLRTEITIPETFASDSALLDVEHISPSANTAQTLSRIERATPKAKSDSKSGTLQLNISINAPNQIFVRGRGLDAELGGSVRLSGPVSNISPQGRFTLSRGRLSILGQRLDLQEGTIALAGDLDPVLNFLASTTSGDVEAFIRLQGTASDLQVSFSSNPELPEDEVLARIIFGRSITDLSPAQIARLASIASELTGGNNPSLINSLRENTGLDDIDVVQDEDGNAAVKAGKYISDNVYLGVQAGQETEATINLDITDSLKARGSVNSEGESTLGVFFEKDY